MSIFSESFKWAYHILKCWRCNSNKSVGHYCWVSSLHTLSVGCKADMRMWVDWFTEITNLSRCLLYACYVPEVLVLLIFSELYIKMYITMLEKCVRLFLKLTYWTHKTHRWLYIKYHLILIRWSFLLHLDSCVKSLPSSTHGLSITLSQAFARETHGNKAIFWEFRQGITHKCVFAKEPA